MFTRLNFCRKLDELLLSSVGLFSYIKFKLELSAAYGLCAVVKLKPGCKLG